MALLSEQEQDRRNLAIFVMWIFCHYSGWEEPSIVRESGLQGYLLRHDLFWVRPYALFILMTICFLFLIPIFWLFLPDSHDVEDRIFFEERADICLA